MKMKFHGTKETVVVSYSLKSVVKAEKTTKKGEDSRVLSIKCFKVAKDEHKKKKRVLLGVTTGLLQRVTEEGRGDLMRVRSCLPRSCYKDSGQKKRRAVRTEKGELSA
jgi:hypothetical protein